jgi:hypothetical protein
VGLEYKKSSAFVRTLYVGYKNAGVVVVNSEVLVLAPEVAAFDREQKLTTQQIA